MRRDRKNKIRKERTVMIACSALVMGALTLTGIYMKDRTEENVDDGYMIDFSQLEGIDDKAQEIAQNRPEDVTDQNGILNQDSGLSEIDQVDLEAGSNLIQIPGLTDQQEDATVLKEQVSALKEQEEPTPVAKEDKAKEDKAKEDKAKEDKSKEAVSKADAKDTVSETVTKKLDFTAEQGLVRPVGGEILMYYSMDKSIYFATLDQYKYNPATVLSATEGDQVTVCADAKVISIYDHEEIGHAVTLDLGNGYQATYGQLKNVQVTEGSYVNRGELLGNVAAPTKYYSLEGPNLYFQLTKDGTPVNAEGLFR